MLTPQDIREKTFEKAVFGGYDMGAVDDFLEELANDLTLMQKENAVLKGKMKVLVDKIEEYRSSEDALRMAILSAQKMGNMIEKEAKEKSEQMVSDAMADAARITKEAALEVDMEKARLEEAKRSSAQFIENMNLLCRKQLDFLTRLQEADFIKEAQKAAAKAPAETKIPVSEPPKAPAAEPVKAPAPKPSPAEGKAPAAEAPKAPELSFKAPAPESLEMHETVKSIEETVAKAASEPVSDIHPNIKNMVADSDDSPTRAFDIVSAAVEANADMDKTTRFDFDSLPFGK